MDICSSHQDAVKLNQNESKNLKSLPTLNPNCKDSMLTLQTDEWVSPINTRTKSSSVAKQNTSTDKKLLISSRSLFELGRSSEMQIRPSVENDRDLVG